MSDLLLGYRIGESILSPNGTFWVGVLPLLTELASEGKLLMYPNSEGNLKECLGKVLQIIQKRTGLQGGHLPILLLGVEWTRPELQGIQGLKASLVGEGVTVCVGTTPCFFPDRVSHVLVGPDPIHEKNINYLWNVE